MQECFNEVNMGNPGWKEGGVAGKQMGTHSHCDDFHALYSTLYRNAHVTSLASEGGFPYLTGIEALLNGGRSEGEQAWTIEEQYI